MTVSSSPESASWRQKVAAKVVQQTESIPTEYLLSKEDLPLPEITNVIDLASESGGLTTKELQITELDDVVILAEKIRNREYTAVEVATAYCKRAAMAQQLVNCLTEIFFDKALWRAAKLDATLEKTGQVVGPLHGVPISVKDQANVVGVETTIGVVSWIGNVAVTNSAVVDSLVAAGAVLYCKTQIPLSLMLSNSKNNIFGRSLNPHNRLLTSGGSSGGEGSLLGFKGSPLGVGTDVLGSIRIPAYCCGVFGLKPSAARISYRGLAALAFGNEGIQPSCGPLARTVAGLELFMSSVLSTEPWRNDPKVVPMPWRPIALPAKCTFAIIRHDNVFMPHPPITRALMLVEEKLKAAGHEVVHMDVGEMWMTGMMLALEIIGANGSKAVVEACEESGEPIYPEILEGPMKTDDMTSHDFFAVIRKKNAFREAFSDWIRKFEAKTTSGSIHGIISPVAGHVAPPIDIYTSPSYHFIWNLMDYPAGVIPVTSVDQVKDVVPAGWADAEAFNQYDKDHRALYTGPELFKDAPVCLQLAVPGILQEEHCVAAMSVVTALL